MSDFLTNLLNRHIGIGEQVLPRIRARFEPDAMTTFLPQNASKMHAMETNNRHNEQEKSHHVRSMVTSPANGTTTNTMDDYNSVKQPVHYQRGPDIRSGEPIKREISRETKYNSSSKSAHRPISEATVNIDKNKVFKNKRAKLSNPSKESAKQRENVSEDMTSANEHNGEKGMDDKVQSSLSRFLSSDEKGHSAKPLKSDNPAHIVTTNNQEGSYNQQSDLDQPATSKAPLGLFLNHKKSELGITESKPGLTTLHNTQIGNQGLLEVPIGLFIRRNELHKGLILKDPKAESEPIVNVTIGRIEVRATEYQAQKQSPRKRKLSGVMSLDKYLSQRIQGGNR